MRITVEHETPEELEVRLRPVFVPAYVVAGLAFVLGGVLVLWAMGSVIQLSVEDQRLSYRRFLLGVFPLADVSMPIGDLRGASVGPGPRFWEGHALTLETVSGDLRVPLAYADGPEKEVLAAELDRVRVQVDGRFEHQESHLWLGVPFGLLVLLAGLVCILALQSTTLSADRPALELCVRRRLWVLPISNRRCISLSDYGRLEIRPWTLWSVKGSRTTSAQLVVVLKDDRALRLTFGPMFTPGSANELKQIVHDWLRGRRPRP